MDQLFGLQHRSRTDPVIPGAFPCKFSAFPTHKTLATPINRAFLR